MLANEELTEIWFETHDDIVLHWQRGGEYVVEFVQVKSGSSTNWSVSEITRRDKSTVGSSLVEKSLSSANCKEKTIFRIVTSTEPSTELQVLKMPRDHSSRNIAGELTSLKAQLTTRLTAAATSANGTTVDDWIDCCLWDKREDSIKALCALNRIEVDKIAEAMGHKLLSDHRDELYLKLLALVMKASTIDLTVAPDGEKLPRLKLIEWWNTTIASLTEVSPHSRKLTDKLRAATLAEDIIEDAKELRWSYVSKRLNRDYITATSFAEAESRALAALSYEKARLDMGDLPDDGPRFHLRCIAALKDIANEPQMQAYGITEAFLRGYMYERASRCPHRFRRVTP